MVDTARVAELEKAMQTKITFINEGIEKGVKIDGSNVEIKQSDWDAMTQARDEVNEIKSLLAMEYLGPEVKSFMDTLKGTPGDGASAHSVAMQVAAQAGMGIQQVKSLGVAFTDSQEFKNLVQSGRLTMDSPFQMDAYDVSQFGTYGQKDVFSSMSGAQHTINHGFGRIQFDPMVPRPQRPTRVRDLFPVATTNANLIDYFRVLGFAENAGEGNAKAVRDRAAADGTSAPTGGATDTFGLKPKSNLTFQSAQAPVRTLAHWEAAHRNVLADEPQLQATINNELLYGLALEEDDQILNGNGTNENLLGLMNTSGTQTYIQANNGATPAVATELKSDALRRAATKAVLANYPPTGYVLHPYDWEDIELQRGTTNDQYMLVTNIAVGAQQQVWRQPVVESPAMTEGRFVTGAWGIGAQLYDRQVASVRIAEQHADFFVRNAVAILVEERLALAVKRPESFVLGTFIG